MTTPNHPIKKSPERRQHQIDLALVLHSLVPHASRNLLGEMSWPLVLVWRHKTVGVS